MISVMEASKATGARTVLVLSKSDIERLHPRVNELPTAVKFVLLTERAIECEFSLLYEPSCGMSKTQSYDFMALPRIVYVPFLSNTTQFQKTWIMKLSLYRRLQIIVSSDVHNRTLRRISPDVLCNVVSVSSRDINAPADRYRRCGERVNVTASSLFASDAAPPNKFPKDQKYRAAVQFLDRSTGDINTNPEVLAMMDAYRVLNNTVNVTEFGSTDALYEKAIDMVLRPVIMNSFANTVLFPDGYYSFARFCFFTRRRMDIRIIFVVSLRLFLEFLMVLTLVGTLVALSVHTRSHILFRGRTLLTLPGFLLFMVGTFFGRCHPISGAQAPSYRSLAVVSWIFGMIFLGNYAQSSITAIRVLPSVSASVRTLEELQPYIETCAMAPCFNWAWGDILLSFTTTGKAPLFPFITSSVLKCWDTSHTRGNMSPCYAKAQAGSHVALSTCSDQDVSAASQWGLVPSDDLFTFPQLFVIHWLNPARLQHRRILFAIAEHGLAVPHRRRIHPQMMDENRGTEPFHLYFGVYLAGCALSCAAFAAEMLCNLKHRRRVGDIPQPRLLAAVS
ncbi:hypothetical protein HPB49_006643 [Dermacentor silvarum]|uniref:Uncharacterized protein n=1 Tax=Dermacentor silvarum TaxID=543639 RepID=A0ACB8CQF1_DERSI|nr:hypothetical protein HPB49_006643 [Dermacentor silvarum]